MFQTLADEEIIEEAQNGNRLAVEYMLKQNMDIVYSKARLFFIKGLDRDDVIQEGMVGLYKAIRDYQLNKGSTFRGFAQLCIHRQLVSAIKSANRQKHVPLNNSTSIYRTINNTENGRDYTEILTDDEDCVEMKYIYKEQLTLLFQELYRELTELELEVFLQYLDNKSYQEISQTLQLNIKTVDNALQRARKKIDKIKIEFNVKELVV